MSHRRAGHRPGESPDDRPDDPHGAAGRAEGLGPRLRYRLRDEIFSLHAQLPAAPGEDCEASTCTHHRSAVDAGPDGEGAVGTADERTRVSP